MGLCLGRPAFLCLIHSPLGHLLVQYLPKDISLGLHRKQEVGGIWQHEKKKKHVLGSILSSLPAPSALLGPRGHMTYDSAPSSFSSLSLQCRDACNAHPAGQMTITETCSLHVCLFSTGVKRKTEEARMLLGCSFCQDFSTLSPYPHLYFKRGHFGYSGQASLLQGSLSQPPESEWEVPVIFISHFIKRVILGTQAWIGQSNLFSSV